MADEKSLPSNINEEFNNATVGLNQDNSLNQVKKGALTYALNAAVENYDSNSVNYQNEPGNELCITFPDGFVLVKNHHIPEKNKHIFFVTNPISGANQIGMMTNNDCVYRVLINAPCLNFSLDHPIYNIVHKITRTGTEIYWADNNGRRYLDIDNIPKVLRDGTPLCNPQYEDELDCSRLLLQPDFNVPIVTVDDVISGGSIKSGVYQFAVQYADSKGNPYTSYYSITNPTPIADPLVTNINFDYEVGKSIVVNIRNLDVSGQFQYFNLAVLKTVNAITTPELVGTYFIDKDVKQITYTGQGQTNIQLTIDDIFEKFVYYDNADYVTTVQDVLVWKGMTISKRSNYQSIANKINLKWETHRIPSTEDYSDETNATNYRGYLRDEIYPFEISFILKNGKETDGFHIPGRDMNSFERITPPISQDNPDFIGNPDVGTESADYWKIYNTATVIGSSPGYSSEEDYKGPYQYGDFAYWESSEEYPCNEDIWGELAGKKIRHHKFPDVNVSPIFESDTFPGSVAGLKSGNKAFFPIGVKVDVQEIKTLIETSDILTQEEKDAIIGFKILRGDRSVNKSIVAKGMLRNVNKYTREEQDFYYPNYPYNDVANNDPFLLAANNAWSQECEKFIVNVIQLTSVTAEGVPCMVVEYKNCNTNKKATIEYTEIGQVTLCSIGKPIIKSPGVTNSIKYDRGSDGDYTGPVLDDPDCIGWVSYANYDVYKIQAGYHKTSGLRCAGWKAQWVDAIKGAYMDVWLNPENSYLIAVQVGTVPTRLYGSNGSDCNVIELRDEIRDTTCEVEVPMPTIEENGEELSYRQVFNSPETSFGQPFLGNILKLENVIYGGGRAHFVEVKDNAKYKLLTKEAQEDALKSAEEIGSITSPFNAGAMFAAYQAYIEIYVNGITRKNYAYSFNSIADYNYALPIPNDLGIKQRSLDIKRYLIPSVQNIGEEITVNNFNRESSVFLRTEGSDDGTVTALPYPHNIPSVSSTGMKERSRFTIEEAGLCSTPAKESPINVLSYYASLKNDFINQWGQIYSYTTIDTGFSKVFDNESVGFDTVFGGDTFIGRFAYKTKVPFFIDNRVGAPDDSDVFYDEIGNIAYPKYWHSSRSILSSFTTVGDVTLSNFISYKAHNFDCPNSQALQNEDDDPATNPDRTFYDGYFYMFAYGVPSFYCESSYNLDLRQAFNNKEGDFWPHVSSGIPDNWVQESFVSIANDNTYTYNTTFSKQNKEISVSHLPEDWSVNYANTSYPFRAVYSDPQITDADNRVNNWLIYRALSYFDFPQNYGGFTALDGLTNRAILARFENKSLLYNNLLTIDTSNPQAAYVGNPNMFSAPPIDFAETDLGYVGCQHKMILKIPDGAVFADAKRGQIFLIQGTQAVDLTGFGSGMQRWFDSQLSFHITRFFPDVNIDNNYKSLGLHGVYDSKYNRIILTKLDYIPLDKNIIYEDGIFKLGKNEVYLNDPDYFCNKSWTLSFNFNTKSWISFHSYLPDWYIAENGFFYSGMNYCPNDFEMLVGVLEETFTTTTTSTTRYIVPTTTTTSTTVIVDCTIEVDVEVPDCELIGNAVVIGELPEPPCVRPLYMSKDAFIHSYDLISPALTVDTTVDSVAMCEGIGTYNVLFGDPNYSYSFYNVEYLSLEVGYYVYLENDSTDCTSIPDGWYFTNETAQFNDGFRIENGYIVEIYSCDPPSSTTTTTSTLPNSYFQYTGVYSNPDPLHPLGGQVRWIDAWGEEQLTQYIWDYDCVTLNAAEIISKTGVILTTCL